MFALRRVPIPVAASVCCALLFACNPSNADDCSASQAGQKDGEDFVPKCGQAACWWCMQVDAEELASSERPTYDGEAVLDLAEGTWRGIYPDAHGDTPVELAVTVTRDDGAEIHVAARALEEDTACDIPQQAREACAGISAAAQIEIVAEPAEFSTTASELHVAGLQLAEPEQEPDADISGFPAVGWEVLHGGDEFNITLLFGPDDRLWMSVDGELREIGVKD